MRFVTTIMLKQTPINCVMMLVLIAMAGCGGQEKPKLVQATGTVTMDGKPLTAGSINFHPASTNSYTKDNPSSLLQLDGSFTMKTFPFGDGVAPGSYKVTLAPELAARIKQPKYAKPETTPWSVDVPDAGLTGKAFEVK